MYQSHQLLILMGIKYVLEYLERMNESRSRNNNRTHDYSIQTQTSNMHHASYPISSHLHDTVLCTFMAQYNNADSILQCDVDEINSHYSSDASKIFVSSELLIFNKS